jgi:hypothetical protein
MGLVCVLWRFFLVSGCWSGDLGLFNASFRLWLKDFLENAPVGIRRLWAYFCANQSILVESDYLACLRLNVLIE